jgi:hypothetical protein
VSGTQDSEYSTLFKRNPPPRPGVFKSRLCNMNTTPTSSGQEAVARRSFGTRHVHEEGRFAQRGVTLPDHPLPPTRAARIARSRGVFFGASTHSRLGHWLVDVLCIVLAAVGIVAGAQFAEPVLDARFVSSNAGPGLVASTMRSSTLLPTRPR